MKVTLDQKAILTLKDILKDKDKENTKIRIYFAGIGWGGPSFGLALDEQKSDDKTYTVEGINFVMSEHDYNQYGDMTINDTGFGFRVAPENSGDGDSCGGGCSGCGH